MEEVSDFARRQGGVKKYIERYGWHLMALADEKSILMQKHCANFRVCTRPKGFTDDIFGRSGVAHASAASESHIK